MSPGAEDASCSCILCTNSTFRLMIETSGVTSTDTVLDVACGPGLVS